MTETFKCAMCKEEFEKGWTDIEAEAEFIDKFSRESNSTDAIVCDDCFTKLENNRQKIMALLPQA